MATGVPYVVSEEDGTPDTEPVGEVDESVSGPGTVVGTRGKRLDSQGWGKTSGD